MSPTPMPAINLARLIVDALVDAGLVAREQIGDAAEIAALEIEVRLACGNVIVPGNEADASDKPIV